MYKFLFYVVLILLIVVFVQSKIYEKRVIKNSITQGTLAPDEKESITMDGNKQTHKTKDETGKKVIVEQTYIPPESTHEVVIKNDGKIEVRYDKYGITAKPFITALFSENITGGVGARFLYYDRYGLGVALDNEITPYLVIDRRIDDIIFDNLAVSFNISIKKFAIGISVYF